MYEATFARRTLGFHEAPSGGFAHACAPPNISHVVSVVTTFTTFYDICTSGRKYLVAETNS